jgi:predicted RNA-binding protein associated with RNAse of E/G family
MKTSKIGRTIGGTQYVICKKPIGIFKKGQMYIIASMYGDPQSAYEAGYEYMVTKFLNSMVIIDSDTCHRFFEWKGRFSHMVKYENLGFFQDYFYVDIAEERKEKLKNIM